MRKSFIYAVLGTIGVSTLTWVFMSPNGRKEKVAVDNKNSIVRKAGIPEEDHTENAKMVAEGSQFGVQYFNQIGESLSADKV